MSLHGSQCYDPDISVLFYWEPTLSLTLKGRQSSEQHGWRRVGEKKVLYFVVGVNFCAQFISTQIVIIGYLYYGKFGHFYLIFCCGLPDTRMSFKDLDFFCV